MTQREESQLRHRLRTTGFPVHKTLDGYDYFAVMPRLNWPKVLALAQCEFVSCNENVLLVGSSGTGKTHLLSPWVLRPGLVVLDELGYVD